VCAPLAVIEAADEGGIYPQLLGDLFLDHPGPLSERAEGVPHLSISEAKPVALVDVTPGSGRTRITTGRTRLFDRLPARSLRLVHGNSLAAFRGSGSLTTMAATEPPQDAPAPAAAYLPPLLDATEAGRLLSVPASWVLAEARANRIPHVRLGRYVRFSADDLEDWWRARMRGPWRSRGAASHTARSLLVDRQAEHGRRPD
jgi:excisionase family DNA binding protein